MRNVSKCLYSLYACFSFYSAGHFSDVTPDWFGSHKRISLAIIRAGFYRLDAIAVTRPIVSKHRRVQRESKIKTHWILTTTTIVLLPFVRDYPGEPVPEETFAHPPSWSSSASSIYYNPQHPPCSNYVLLSLFAQPLSVSSLVYLLVWSLPSTLYSIHFFTNQFLLFATHAHTIVTCFAVVYHLLIVFLLTPYLELYLNTTHPSDHSHLCSLKCRLIFFPDRPGLTYV